MAEIHVQTKKRSNTGWIWIILGVILLAIVGYIVITRSNPSVQDNTSTQQASPTSYVQPVQGDTVYLM